MYLQGDYCLAISYLAPFDGDEYLENTLGCILRMRTIYSFEKEYHYEEFWRENLFYSLSVQKIYPTFCVM